MRTFLHNHWRKFKASAPGRRFQDVHQRRTKGGSSSNGVRRNLLIGAGVLLAVAGVVLLPVPGPGSLVLLLGVALIASESLLVARMLDRAELLIRPSFLRLRRWWKRT